MYGSRTNADDRLTRDPLGWIECRDGIVERRDVADVCPQASATHTPNDLSELHTIGFDNEVDGDAVRRSRLGGPDDGQFEHRPSRRDFT